MDRPFLRGILLACLLAVSATAQTFIWTGNGGNTDFFTPGNWQGGVPPTSSPTTNLLFPDLPLTLDQQGNFNATLDSAFSVGDLTFDGQYYGFNLYGTGSLTVNGGIVVHNVANIGVPLALAAGNHTISGESYVFQAGLVSGSGSFTINGGNLGLFNNPGNTYTGGTTLNSGGLYAYFNTSLGTGTVALNGGILNIYPQSGASLRLANNFVLGANVSFATTGVSGTAGIGDGSHSITAATGVSTVNLNMVFGGTLYIDGAITNGSGPTTYTFTNGSDSEIHLSGNNTYTGGTLIKDGGAVTFETAGSIPASGLISAESDGYAAVSDNSLFPTLLSRINPANFAGTIGFDTGVAYAGNIDLSGFTGAGSSVSLGTLGRATLSGLITPSGSAEEYNFRSSGTLLLTGSNPLSGSNDVISATLPGRPAGMVVLSESTPNTYNGTTVADGGAIVFDSAGSKPAGSSLRLQNGGYIGFTDTSGLTLPDLVNAVITQSGATSVLGIDTHATIVNQLYPTYTYSNPINLGVLSNPVYLGTASNVTVSGGIVTTNTGGDDYYLTGYQSGTLTVSSQLTGNRSLFVGLPGLYENGTVHLTNTNNTYTDGTTINSGGLIVAAPGSLGTGDITASPTGFNGTVILEGPSSVTIPNNIILASGQLSVYASNSTLSGFISGPGGIIVNSNLTLSGNNAYAGETEVDFVHLTATTNTGIGTGGLNVIRGATVEFTQTVPHIGSILQGGLFDDGDGTIRTATIVLTNPGGGTLTVNQTVDGDFDGVIAQGGTGPVSLVKNGSGMLTISGHIDNDNAYTTRYAGGTTINAGTLIASGPNAFGPGTITINGGALGTTTGVVLSNPIAFGASGGTLAGNGTFATPITVGANVTLAPGASPGILTFTSGLTLAGAGTLQFQVQSAVGPPGTGYDLVNISAGLLNITATTGSKFTIQLTSLDFFGGPGNVYDFSAGSSYSWVLFQGNTVSGITGFAANKFSLDASGFTNGLAGGTFSLSQGVYGGNPSLYLNFTPVPEPSTWLLMGGGLAALVAAARRRRHA